MKHAYLILAHHQFGLLELLVKSLDHACNAIFIHVDKKVAELPVVQTKNAALYVLDERVDVYWGDLSVVEAEYVLFEAASHAGHYDYFHLISGVDLPIKSSDDIRQFFERNKGREFIGFYKDTEFAQLDRKMQRYHIFPHDFIIDGSRSNTIKRIIRAVLLRIQIALGLRRNKNIDFRKGTQWVSVTSDFVHYLLSCKEVVLKTYHHTYCPDEVYKQTLCWNSTFRDNVYDMTDEGRGSLRAIGWQDGNLYDWTDQDFEEIMQSEGLFARKFNSNDMEVVHKIFREISK
ncbi:beta-1,6-N-acetylglucosaminyltransferase [Sphingobacterium corticibacterium]|uniref:Peptide O-xylosyltransferase n=1 Tax=Sphingobacterium corticibacterium TaxID=2484746 RepID=A0A4Q6XVG9_9SPHI|nr:beta-1,6-N-acetylglucosaminyltransferase [Sphingobacterium corticibacterium]RZF61682.1 glycosyl transferase [Sphingobacterium corticibacterium]